MRVRDEEFVNQRYLDLAKRLFRLYFRMNIRLCEEWSSNDSAGMGAFHLAYYHQKTDTQIVFEYQKLCFDIVIVSMEKGNKISLSTGCKTILKSTYGTKWEDSELTESNIKRAIIETYRIVEKKGKELMMCLK